ncbi:predicted protein [Aspergillus terreus NIH2624]|uniref:Geodin cluster transcription factor n=1 Tax=Aspergillus terreus (strain NIH 2624 / FGSC A1156) TaxID=341663 RepID=GEDR_ASPTN|nr:uncharacterized protein ATEG_08453 [Aspergillus terreus NIH2624]Q0CCY1.1 RecName: Full=Geodin cluster transcription factor; AltName: Full=Geodin synthesis protein R [Aspergillus terreus NIH2624]EAU31626.1 predicted protein [Aspergillus terreus NIH2624]
MSAEGHKLRGSCHACAASKVRCSKEKPTCSRCSKRGTTCEYLITKRPGRKQLNNRSTAKESSNTTRTSLATVPQGLLEPDPMSTAIPLADQPPWSPPGTTPSSLDVFSSLFDSAEGSWSLPLADWDNEVDEYLTHLAMPRTANSEPLDAEGGITSSHNTSSNSPARPPTLQPVCPQLTCVAQSTFPAPGQCRGTSPTLVLYLSQQCAGSVEAADHQRSAGRLHIRRPAR